MYFGSKLGSCAGQYGLAVGRVHGVPMAKLINELLLLTCMGGFIASATYAVTLLHRA